jgi:pimeloyl-ACP methyl ester carboxylesterase
MCPRCNCGNRPRCSKEPRHAFLALGRVWAHRFAARLAALVDHSTPASRWHRLALLRWGGGCDRRRATIDGIRKGVVDDRSQFFKDLAIAFYGYNRPDAKVSQGVIDSFWRQGMAGSIKGLYDCIKQFSEVDYTEDLRKIDVPTPVLHGDDDQIVPIDAAGRQSAKIVKNATLKVYAGGQHGMCTVEADQVNADLLDFIGA